MRGKKMRESEMHESVMLGYRELDEKMANNANARIFYEQIRRL